MPAEPISPTVENRSEFVLFFDVADGNPNGDPDAGNAPRVDPRTGQGLVTDVCLKRKIRNYVRVTQVEGPAADPRPRDGCEIYVKERGILALHQRRAYEAQGKAGEKFDNDNEIVKYARAWMCRTFYDIRAFGAVTSTGKAGDEDAEPKPEKAKPAKRPRRRSPPAPRSCGTAARSPARSSSRSPARSTRSWRWSTPSPASP